MLCPSGGGGPRDEVGSLIIRAHPTWGILANFEQKCWPQGPEVWTMLKQRKATSKFGCAKRTGSLDTRELPESTQNSEELERISRQLQ